MEMVPSDSRCCSAIHGQKNNEAGPFAWLAQDVNLSAMLLDNAIAGCQPQSSALVRIFGRIKGLKNMPQLRRRHANAVVLKQNLNMGHLQESAG